MDLAEIRSSLKGEVRKFSEKSARTSICESPLKIPGHLVQLLASRILIPDGAHSSVSRGREEEADDGQALVPATVFQSLNSMSSFWLGTSSCAQICIIAYTLKPVLRIHDIFVWIRIRIWIRGSMPLTNGSGCGSGSSYFLLLKTEHCVCSPDLYCMFRDTDKKNATPRAL
jgi:hypothetical protein